jgi:hypothetical protein
MSQSVAKRLVSSAWARVAASMVSLTLCVGGCAAVMGIKERVFSPLPREVSLEGLVPRKTTSTDGSRRRWTSPSSGT